MSQKRYRVRVSRLRHRASGRKEPFYRVVAGTEHHPFQYEFDMPADEAALSRRIGELLHQAGEQIHWIEEDRGPHLGSHGFFIIAASPTVQ